MKSNNSDKRRLELLISEMGIISMYGDSYIMRCVKAAIKINNLYN